MSRSLGTLTLDLIAKTAGFVEGMSKAERSSDKWRKQVKKDAEAVGVAIGASVAAVGAAVAAMTAQALNAAKEINQFASLSNASALEFQRMAAGADVAGISQEKLADQMKDFNEKVGEFLQTGGGGMKDFFDNIAPRIGITQEAFKDLSGPQGLQLYYDSLETAGLSQKEMSFYLESMASDTTALIPLLQDGGAGFDLMGDAAERAGAIMGEQTLDAANQLNATLRVMEMQTTGARNAFMTGLLPALADVSDAMFDQAGASAIAAEAGETFGTVVKGLASVAFGAYAAVNLLGKSLGGMGAIFAEAELNAADAIAPATAIIKIAKSALKDRRGVTAEVLADLDQTAQEYGRIISGFWDESGSGPDSLISKIAELQSSADKARQSAAASVATSAAASSETTKAAKSSAEAIAKQREEEKRLAEEIKKKDAALLGSIAQEEVWYEKREAKERAYINLVSELRTEEEKLTDQLRARLAVLDAVDTATSQDYSRAASGMTAEAPQYGGLAPEVGGAAGELNKIAEAETALNDWYATQLAMVEQFRTERADLNATWDAEELALKQEHEAQMAGLEQARHAASMAAAETAFGHITDATKTFAGEQSAIYKAMFIVQKAFAIAESIVAIQQGIAKAASLQWPMNLAAMASVAAATASIVGNIQAVSVSGMAHDGIDAVPKTGTWLLEKGERVLTANTSAKLDKQLEQTKAQESSVRIINVMDPAVVGDYLDTPAGERMIMNVVQRNQGV